MKKLITISVLYRLALSACAFMSVMSVHAGTQSFTNTATITSQHVLAAPISLGASASYVDATNLSLPLFDTDVGKLKSITLRVQSTSGSFTGVFSATLNLIGLNLLYTQTQQVSYALGNFPTNGAGPGVGPVNQLLGLPVGVTTQIVNTNPASIDSTLVLTNAAALAAFKGLGGGTHAPGTFQVNPAVSSFYQLGLLSVGSSLNGNGSVTLRASVTYDYDAHGAVLLGVQKSGTNVVVTWPGFAYEYQLQRTPQVGPSSWSTINSGFFFTNEQFRFVVQTNLFQEYFQLALP
jgi:hypothetical protein